MSWGRRKVRAGTDPGGGRVARRSRRPGLIALALPLAACSGALLVTPPCVPLSTPVALPLDVPESSGVEPARWGDDAYWTHNDSGGDAVLFAIDGDGGEVRRLRVLGARNRDWEDLAAGRCGRGERCLYVADAGDNRLIRRDPAVYRIREPVPGEATEAAAARFPIVFPHGPRDIEAFYLLPGERLFFVTKGRAGPVELYRYPGPLREEEPVTLERIQTLTRRAPLLPAMVTGAASTDDGRLVAIRTYESLTFYRPDEEGRLTEIPRGRVNLRPLDEPQGEAVAFVPGNRLVLTSEAGFLGPVGSMVFLSCALPGESW